MTSALIRTLRGENVVPRPLWLMRQAGRYLPEYRALRAEKGGFLDLVYDHEAAAEITLQPLRRFDFDGAILFSDILIVPHALGQGLTFVAGEGPRLSPPLTEAELDSFDPAPEHYEAVWRTVALLAKELGPEKTLIGFSGAPWTVATYMVAGQGSKEQAPARQLAYRDPARFQAIIDRIVESTIDYLDGQVEAGAQALQVFDSWSGSLAPDEFERWVIAPTAQIVSEMKRRRPDTPIIGFPKGAGAKLPAYVRETGVDAVGLDETVDPRWAHDVLPDGLPVQGNFDPQLLLSGSDRIESSAREILDALAGRPHIFNLGHGIDRFTPIENVERLVAAVKGWTPGNGEG